MNPYEVKKIDMSKVKTMDEYWAGVRSAPVHYCKGLKELREYCGGKLHRERHGYAGVNGSIEYVAVRVS